MKKSFLYSVMALFMCLFAACSQEEIVSDGELGSNKVSLSVKIPAMGPVSRAAVGVEGYTMRCIMELVDKDGAVIAESRQTKTVETDGTTSFDFTKPSGAYTCLFWADYVKGDKIDGKEIIYKADNLTNIVYRLNKSNDLFNNKAVDAFCGKLASTGISSGQNVTLKRPFTRIAITKEVLAQLGEGLDQCLVSMNAGTSYNIHNGKTIATTGLNNTDIDGAKTPITILPNADMPFYCFVFPSNDKLTSNSTISFSNSSDQAVTAKLEITANQMKEMKPNVAVNMKPKDDTKGSVEIVIDNSFESGDDTTDPEPEEPTEPETPAGAAKVGDYFYSDGTWGASATKTGVTTVGVVFALASEDGAAAADVIANYTGKNMTKINGWVVSATNISGKKFLADETTATLPKGVGSTTTDILGFTNTNLWNTGNASTETYSAIKAVLDYNTDVPVSTETNKNSGWYLPSAGQMTALIAVYAENNNKVQGTALIVKTKLQALLDAETGELMADGYHWSSTGILDKDSKVCAFRVGFHATTNYANCGANNGLSSGSSVRPVLTF